MTQTQTMVLRSSFMSQTPVPAEVRAGQTIRGMLLEAAGGKELYPDLLVKVNGYVVPASHWDRLRPKPGAAIHVIRDGIEGGGDTWKQVLGAIVLIVVSYFTAGAATTWGASLAGAAGMGAGAAAAINIGIMMVATLAVSALTAPPQPSNPGGTEGRWNQLTGSQNGINPWGAIPFVIGESRFFPPHAAMPYGQVVGESSFQHCMFDLGHGDLDVSDIRIGDTPIGDYDDVQWEITKGDSLLYQNDVAELAVNASLENGVAVQRTSSPGLDAVGVEIVFGQGLFWVNDRGRSFDYEARFPIRWRANGGAWQEVPANARRGGCRKVGGSEVVRVLNKTPFGIGITWDVPAGAQIDIEVNRTAIAGEDTRNTYVQAATWTILRSIKHTNPSTTGTNKLYVRIRANDQLTGTLQTLSCLVRQKVPVYNRGAGTWSAPQTTMNPAWCTWWLMTQCPAVAKLVPLSRMDLDGFADYAEWCDQHQLQTRMVVDSTMTMGELIRKVLSGALASPGHRDGRYTVVYDHGDTLPTMAFTPLETTGFTVSRAFTRIPHALKVQFKNPEADWQDDEIIVVRDGYSHRGLDARGNPSSLPEPTDFETLRVEQAMLPPQAWRQGRYHFAQALFRPNIYSFSTDHAGLSTVRGDVVDVAHDVLDNGSQGWGRVVSLTAGGPDGAAATLVLEETIDCPAGQLYGVQIRTALGDKLLAYATPHSVSTDTFYLATMPAGVAPGDAAVIGLRGAETVKLLITGVRAAQDLGASFSCVAYDPRVAPYWADPPGSIISEISGRDYGLPAPPVISGIVSAPANDETDNAGIPVPTVNIGFRDRGGYMDVPYQVMAR